MSKYFSGISLNEGKYTISIIDDSLNIIFMDILKFNELCELLKRKTITTVSIDAPVLLYAKYGNTDGKEGTDNLELKKRNFDNLLASKNMLTYEDRFNADRKYINSIMELYDQLRSMGFSYKNFPDGEKCIIESYPDTSLIAMGWHMSKDIPQNDILRRKIEILRDKNIRIKSYLKKGREYSIAEINTLIQSYTSHLYHTNGCTVLGSQDEGILVFPNKDSLNRKEHASRLGQKNKPFNGSPINKTKTSEDISPEGKDTVNKKFHTPPVQTREDKGRVMAEYCGAQYLYTNVDGSIRINDLRPIKSYGPFTDIYELNSIKRVQVFMCTIDGLRRVKANFVPYSGNSEIFKAADDEDKRKLDSFWGNDGDKRGYLIKFNRVEVIKA